MNIVHLISNKVWGGGERYVLDLCRRSEADGHSVAVLTRGREAVDKPFRDAGFTPGHLPLRGALDDKQTHTHRERERGERDRER